MFYTNTFHIKGGNLHSWLKELLKYFNFKFTLRTLINNLPELLPHVYTYSSTTLIMSKLFSKDIWLLRFQCINLHNYIHTVSNLKPQNVYWKYTNTMLKIEAFDKLNKVPLDIAITFNILI